MIDVTNSLVKWVYSLSQKKNRDREKCFVVEGSKCVLDTIGAFAVRYLFATKEWVASYGNGLPAKPLVVSLPQLSRMSALKTASNVIAVCEMPEMKDTAGLDDGLSLVLDGVQDPGNMGTILRVADWFGIRTVVCSEDTVDVYNPKVVQATMGALARVSVIYADLCALFRAYAGMPVFGTFLDGENIYRAQLGDKGFIVMGNEGNGISSELEKYMTRKLRIPSYPVGAQTSESLNVGMATAIVVGEFRRRMM